MSEYLALKDKALVLSGEVRAKDEKLIAAMDAVSALKDQLIAEYKISVAQYKKLDADMNEAAAIRDQMLAMHRQFIIDCGAILSKPSTK